MSHIEIPLDAHLRIVRVGNIVQQTIVIQHTTTIYTIVLRGKVVEVQGRAIRIMLNQSYEEISINPWDPKDWAIVGYEALS